MARTSLCVQATAGLPYHCLDFFPTKIPPTRVGVLVRHGLDDDSKPLRNQEEETPAKGDGNASVAQGEVDKSTGIDLDKCTTCSVAPP